MSKKVELPPAARPEAPADPNNVPILFSDGPITSGCHEDIVNVTLGVLNRATLNSDGSGPQVRIVCQLRFSRVGAEKLRVALGIDQENAPGGSEPGSIPRNPIN